jgi:hypothetical protein
MLVLLQDAWNAVFGNSSHVQVTRQNFLASTMANPCCCCDFVYRSGPTGMLITFKTVSPLCKRFVTKRALRAKAPSLYGCFIIWNVSLKNLPNFGITWRLPVAQTATFSISAAHRQLPFTTVTLFLNTPHVRNFFLLKREKNGHGTILCLHVYAVGHNCIT